MPHTSSAKLAVWQRSAEAGSRLMPVLSFVRCRRRS